MVPFEVTVSEWCGAFINLFCWFINDANTAPSSLRGGAKFRNDVPSVSHRRCLLEVTHQPLFSVFSFFIQCRSIDECRHLLVHRWHLCICWSVLAAPGGGESISRLAFTPPRRPTRAIWGPAVSCWRTLWCGGAPWERTEAAATHAWRRF